MLVPIFVFVIGHLFVAFLNARHTAIMSDLYYSFQQFEKNLDIACKTLPEVIDYEILFTKKEIKENIPALQEYLEKAEALEKKRKEDEAMLALIGENYDFEELGVDNSLLLERAMKESEKYLNVKRNFSERIRSKEQEKVNYQKNFDEVTKDFERKAQASREIINSLSEQINATTVKIEANYLKKKLNEEQARYQQYEKDYDLASTRFQKEQHDIQYEIDKFNEEIKRRKDQATENMMAEAKTYVNKIYGQVTETVLKQNAPVLDENQITINKLNEEVARLNETLSAKENEIKEKEKKIDEVRQELNLRLAELESTKTLRDYITSEEFRTRLVMSKRDLKKLAKEDREAFKHTKKEMQQPFDNSAAEDAGVQVVKLEDTFNDGYNQEVAAKEADVQVVKLPDADDKTDDYITKNELREIKADLEAANKKLDENTNDLNEQISKVKGKKEPQTKSLNNLKDRMSKLNAKTKQALNEEPAAPAKKTTTPKFNVPKIKK